MLSDSEERGVLAYVPSKGSAYGHAFLPRMLPKLVPHLLRFFRDFTLSSGPTGIRLDVYGPTQFDAEDHSATCTQKVLDFVATPAEPGDFHIGPVGGPAKRMNRTWRLEAAAFEKALDFMVRGHPWPKQLFGPVTLQFSYQFIWRDPRTGQPFPGQEQGYYTRDGRLTCEFLVQLERKSFIQPELTFPYDLSDPRLYEMLSILLPALPFKLTAKHLRRQYPLRSGTGFEWARIPPSELVRLSEFVK